MTKEWLIVKNDLSASVMPAGEGKNDPREIVTTLFPELKPSNGRSESAEIILWRKTNKVFRQPSELLRSIVRDSRAMGSTMRAETPNHELAG